MVIRPPNHEVITHKLFIINNKIVSIVDLKNKKSITTYQLKNYEKIAQVFSHVNSHACLAFFDQIMYFN